MKKFLALLMIVCLSFLFNCSTIIIESSDNTKPIDSEEQVVRDYWHDTRKFGINVDENGVMKLGDSLLYEAGVNCYNLFNQCFEDGFSSQKAKQTLDVLSDHGIKVVRFNLGGYLSDWIDLYYNNKTAFINLLADICLYAETLRVGLIPSFFWLYHAVPDYFDEPLRWWGKSESKTLEFLNEYVKTIVGATKDFKAIFAWEFGNEFNLSCDLPNAFEHMPALSKASKRTERTKDDCLSADDVNFAIKEFVKAIKSLDQTGRMITTGNATLRPSQYNQLEYGSWNQDSVFEFRKITEIFTPDGVSAVSEHVYFLSQTTFGKELTLEEYLSYATENAKSLGKAYFVGEWGGGSENDYSYYSRIGNAFIDAGVQLCLLWNFNFVEGSIEYSFSANSERGQTLLKVLKEMNERYETEF